MTVHDTIQAALDASDADPALTRDGLGVRRMMTLTCVLVVCCGRPCDEYILVMSTQGNTRASTCTAEVRRGSLHMRHDGGVSSSSCESQLWCAASASRRSCARYCAHECVSSIRCAPDGLSRSRVASSRRSRPFSSRCVFGSIASHLNPG
jgi:hypothetical protein